MNNRKNAYTEVYTILEDLDEEEYNKIPPEIIETIRVNRNVEYNYELNENLELKEHQLLPETKLILFNLFRDYLATSEQKQKIIEMQNEERQKNELKKQQQYNTDVFENKAKEEKEVSKIKEESHELIEYKENIFTRLIARLKKFFGNSLQKRKKYDKIAK